MRNIEVKLLFEKEEPKFRRGKLMRHKLLANYCILTAEQVFKVSRHANTLGCFHQSIGIKS
jgi:hypothetical protein